MSKYSLLVTFDDDYPNPLENSSAEEQLNSEPWRSLPSGVTIIGSQGGNRGLGDNYMDISFEAPNSDALRKWARNHFDYFQLKKYE